MKTPHTTIRTAPSGDVTTTVSLRADKLPPKVSKTRPKTVYSRSSFRVTTPQGVHVDIPASWADVITWIVYTVYDTDTMNASDVKRAFRHRLKYQTLSDGTVQPAGLSSVGCTLNDKGDTIATPIQSVDCQNGAGERAPRHVAQPGKAFHAWEVRGTRQAIDSLCEHWLVVQSGIASHAPMSVKPPMNAIGSMPDKVKAKYKPKHHLTSVLVPDERGGVIRTTLPKSPDNPPCLTITQATLPLPQSEHSLARKVKSSQYSPPVAGEQGYTPDSEAADKKYNLSALDKFTMGIWSIYPTPV